MAIEVISPSDLGPIANDDQYAVVEGGVLSVALPGFLANDADPDDETLTATVITSAVMHGSLSAFPNGSFTYTPNAGYTGPDAFSYEMQDASGNRAQATVTITVLVDPDKDPIAVADLYSVIAGTTLSRPAPGFLANDGDPDGAPLTAVLIVDAVDHGSLSAFPDGSFSYTPNAGYVGPDAFTYRMRDASGNTADATVAIQVLPTTTMNPIANADSYVAFDGRVLQVAAAGFLANDLDPDGQALTATVILDGVDHGSLIAFPDGSFRGCPGLSRRAPRWHADRIVWDARIHSLVSRR